MPRQASVSAWSRFTLAVIGSFYTLMTASLFVHEVLGHGLTSVLLGSTAIRFAVHPGFSGWAAGIPPVTSDWVRYGGILANAIVGLVSLFLLRFTRPPLRPSKLFLFWLGATELGHAVGYTLQGLLFRQGDAAGLSTRLGGFVTVLAAILLAFVFMVLARWALGSMAGFVRDHFQSATRRDFRLAFLTAFTLPMAAIIIAAPGLPHRETWTRVTFDAAILTVLIAGTLWIPQPPVSDPDTEGRPLTWSVSMAWGLGALCVLGVTARWLGQGTTLAL